MILSKTVVSETSYYHTSSLQRSAPEFTSSYLIYVLTEETTLGCPEGDMGGRKDEYRECLVEPQHEAIHLSAGGMDSYGYVILATARM